METLSLSKALFNMSGKFKVSNSTEANSSKFGEHYETDELYMVQHVLPYMLVGVAILVLGISGNSLTIGYIVNKHLFKNPTYAVIALLSITDLIALLFRGAVYMVALLLPLSLSVPISTHLLWITYLTLNASNFHIILLARLRYKLIIHPLRRVTMASLDMVKLSALAWTVSIVLGIIYSLSIYIDLEHISVVVAEMLANAFSFFSVSIPVLLYHHLKIRRLRRRITRRHAATTRMSIVITLILSMQVLSIATFTVSGILAAYHIFSNILTFGTHAFLMLTHSVNPFIYFLVFMCYRRSRSMFASYRIPHQHARESTSVTSQIL